MNKRALASHILTVSLTALLLSGCASNRVDTRTYTGTFGDIAQQDPAILAAREREYQAQQQKIIASSDMMPELALTASATTYLADDLVPAARDNELDYGVGLTWSIFRSVAAVKGVRASQASLDAAGAALRAEENQLLLDITSAIAQLNRADKVEELRSQQLARLRAYYSDQQQRKAAGEISETDLQQIQGRIARAQSALATAEADQASAVAKLQALGLSPNHDIQLAAAAAHIPPSEQAAVRIAEAHNPAVQESNLRLNAAEDNIAVASAELAPDLSLAVNLGHSSTEYVDDSAVINNNANIRLGLRVPLFDGGRRIAEFNVKQSQVREMQFQAQTTQSDVSVGVRGLWHNYQAAINGQRFARNRYAVAVQSLAGIREALKVGARSVADELAAMDEVTEAQIAMYTAKHDAELFGHQLMSQMGIIAKAYNLSGNR